MSDHPTTADYEAIGRGAIKQLAEGGMLNGGPLSGAAMLALLGKSIGEGIGKVALSSLSRGIGSGYDFMSFTSAMKAFGEAIGRGIAAGGGK